MVIWIDAQISPAVAAWVNRSFPLLTAHSVRSQGLLYASDMEIFNAAKLANVVIMTKDQDFYHLLSKYGIPPQIIWLTMGNTTSANLFEKLLKALPIAVDLIEKGEPIVEIK